MWSVLCPYREVLVPQEQFDGPHDLPRLLPREVALDLNARRSRWYELRDSRRPLRLDDHPSHQLQRIIPNRRT